MKEIKSNKRSLMILLLFLVVMLIGFGIIMYNRHFDNDIKVTKLENMVSGTWQGEVRFPDWKGYVDDTLAMNSMYSFNSYKDQGKIYLTISSKRNSYKGR